MDIGIHINRRMVMQVCYEDRDINTDLLRDAHLYTLHGNSTPLRYAYVVIQQST